MHLSRLIKLQLLCGLTLAFTSLSYAAPWQFEITPYIWAINMNGHVGVGPVKAHVDETFSDILKHLDFAGMIEACAHYNQTGIYLNAIYASLADDASFDRIKIRATNNYGIFGGGLSYRLWEHAINGQQSVSFEPYLGLRYTLNNTTLKIGPFQAKKDVSWTDPVIGFKSSYRFNANWLAQIFADIGGTNGSTDYSYNLGALAGYRYCFQATTLTTILGYRYFAQHYQTGHELRFYDWNMHLFGPILGVSFGF